MLVVQALAQALAMSVLTIMNCLNSYWIINVVAAMGIWIGIGVGIRLTQKVAMSASPVAAILRSR